MGRLLDRQASQYALDSHAELCCFPVNPQKVKYSQVYYSERESSSPRGTFAGPSDRTNARLVGNLAYQQGIYVFDQAPPKENIAVLLYS
jgi:hypothetical protein